MKSSKPEQDKNKLDGEAPLSNKKLMVVSLCVSLPGPILFGLKNVINLGLSDFYQNVPIYVGYFLILMIVSFVGVRMLERWG